MGFKRYTLAAALLIGAGQLLGTTPAYAAKTCKLEIAGNDMMQFDKKELKVAGDCTEVELTLKHTGKLPAAAMGHNWVLSKTGDAMAVANAGLAAGLKNDHVPPGDKRVIAHTKVIGGGESTTVKFPTTALKKGEAYTYVCTFPGHSSIMKGTLTFG
jgi:azurin